MKKLIVMSVLIMGIVFVSGQSFAQTTQSTQKDPKVQTTQTSQNTPGNFVDKNGDGVCDNHQTRGTQAKCAKFVDANGDGVCDNCKGKGNCGQGNCCKNGMGNQYRHGQCNPSDTTAPKAK